MNATPESIAANCAESIWNGNTDELEPIEIKVLAAIKEATASLVADRDAARAELAAIEKCPQCGYSAWRVSVETGAKTCAVCYERDRARDFLTEREDARADTVTLADRLATLLDHFDYNLGRPPRSWRVNINKITLGAIERAEALPTRAACLAALEAKEKGNG